MYIVQGAVDLLLHYQPPPPPRTANPYAQTNNPSSRSRGDNGGGGMDEMTADADMMMPIGDEQSRYRRMRLLKASGKASEFINTLLGASGMERAPFRRLI